MDIHRILAIGECMVELSDSSRHHYKKSFAGDTFNTLYYLAQSKSNYCAFLSVVGQDPLSDEMLNYIKQQNISTEFIYKHPTKTPGLYIINNDASGERNFMYYRNQSAATTLLSFWANDLQKKIYLFDAIYLSGISLAILEHADAFQLINYLIDYKAQGGKIYFDNNYRANLWSSPSKAQMLFKQIHQLADLIFVTYDDEKQCYQDNTIENCITRYLAFSGTTIIKDGSNPLYIIQNNRYRQLPVLKVDKIIDTTGAGDAFNAGFISLYQQSNSIVQACQRGCQIAAQVIQHKGAII